MSHATRLRMLWILAFALGSCVHANRGADEAPTAPATTATALPEVSLVQPSFQGYTDCQVQCINGVDCDRMQDCSKADSDAYFEYCIGDRDIPRLVPPPEEAVPSNGTMSGSAAADGLLAHPSVQVAVTDSGFKVHYGDAPPDIVGLYRLANQVDLSKGSRSTGLRVEASACFSGQERLAGGSQVGSCLNGVSAEEVPVTGHGDEFTAFVVIPELAIVLFSGRIDTRGRVVDGEILVSYVNAVDRWEHGHTEWNRTGTCLGCP